MPKIIIDGQTIECRPGANVLQAALEAGFDIPHYCYHPNLSVVASCRLCLMEQKMPHPQTKEMGWAPRLLPSCQTPVRDNPDGSPMEVRFNSPAVKNNQEHVMEYFLINHPLDCPICDQAGECYLQDYSLKFGKATSRMVEEKNKEPKKDIGSKTYLYQDRCVMCTRCVRFTREVAGTAELCVINRGERAEIDVFPGHPLENPLQGNVVDLCPVGCLLDKDFLFKQRVWFLQETPSITVADASGANIRIDHNDGRVYRLKPRYNPQVNGWWISDEQRYSYQHVHSPQRLTAVQLRDAGPLGGEAVGEALATRLEASVARHGPGKTLVVLSPFLANEEAWMIATLVRKLDPQATLGLGPVPVEGQDQLFPVGTTDPAKAKFVIRAEKCPNRRGVEAVLAQVGGPRLDYGDDAQGLSAAIRAGQFRCVWITGGQPKLEACWRADLAQLFAEAGSQRPELIVVQDLYRSALTEQADLAIPAASFAERAGTFTNCQGLTQRFERAIDPIGDFVPDGEWLWNLTGHIGLFDPEQIRNEMWAAGIRFEYSEAVEVPEHAH